MTNTASNGTISIYTRASSLSPAVENFFVTLHSGNEPSRRNLPIAGLKKKRLKFQEVLEKNFVSINISWLTWYAREVEVRSYKYHSQLFISRKWNRSEEVVVIFTVSSGVNLAPTFDSDEISKYLPIAAINRSIVWDDAA